MAEKSEEVDTGKLPVVDKEDTKKLCNEMFQKIVDYVAGQLSSTAADYGLLKALNEATGAEYERMASTTTGLNKDVETLRQKYSELMPYLEQIDSVEESINKLQDAAKELDQYSKRLEIRFKQLDKR
eukprot:m.252876 g.252876  ORF g.252876 m.252876 type:complete len:127 (+) comp16158_c2_seq1:303-683(+)